MNSTEHRELKDATRAARIAAMVAVFGILLVGIGLKVAHDLMEARHDAVSDARR